MSTARKVFVAAVFVGVAARLLSSGPHTAVPRPVLESTAFGCDAAPAHALHGDAAPTVRPVTTPPPRHVSPPTPAISTEEWTDRINRLADVFPRTAKNDLFKLEHYCRADFDRDDEVTPADITAFMDVWTRGDDLTGYLADFNSDGALDQQDIDTFFDAYFNNTCDPGEYQNARSYIC